MKRGFHDLLCLFVQEAAWPQEQLRELLRLMQKTSAVRLALYLVIAWTWQFVSSFSKPRIASGGLHKPEVE